MWYKIKSFNNEDVLSLHSAASLDVSTDGLLMRRPTAQAGMSSVLYMILKVRFTRSSLQPGSLGTQWSQSSWNDSCDSLHDSLVTAYLDGALHHQEGAGEEGEAEEVGGALLLPQLEHPEA